MENIMLTITLFVFYFSFMCILFYNQEVESTLTFVSATPTLSDYAQAFSVEPDQEENQSQLDAINQVVQSSNKKQLRKLCSLLKIKQTRTEQGKRVELTAAQMKTEIIKYYHFDPNKVMETALLHKDYELSGIICTENNFTPSNHDRGNHQDPI